MALTAALCAGLVVTALPASASITSADYTIGTPTGQVASATATPAAVTASASTNFEVSFTTPTSLSGGADSWVNITPSVVLSSVPTSVAIAGGSCIQSGTAGAAGSGLALTSLLTIDLGATCTLTAGSSVQVFFTAEAPASIGTFDFAVTTSSDSTTATSNNVTVGTTVSPLSALSYSFGANTSYTISNIAVGSGGAGTTLELISDVTSGTEPMTFYNGAAGYEVTVTPLGGTAAADTVDAAVSSGSSVSLTLGTALVVGETVSVVADGTNPAQSGTFQSDEVVILANAAPGLVTNSITFGDSVSQVTVVPSSTVAGASATYTVTFRAATTATGDIFMSEIAGPTNFSAVTGAEVSDTTQGWHSISAVVGLGSGSVEIPFTGTIVGGDVISVTLANVYNPATGSISDFTVWTSSDAIPAAAPTYNIGVNASLGVVVTVNPSAIGALATYTLTNVYATAALTGGTSTISIDGPSGTVFPNSPAEYSITDTTTSSGTGTVLAALVGGATADVTLTVPENINVGDEITITVQDVINPSTASSTDVITLSGNVTGPAPTAPTTTTTAPTTTTTLPKPLASFTTTKATVAKKFINLRVYCARAACQGTITLTDVRTIVGTKKYQVAAGKSTSFTIGVNSKGLALLAAAKDKTITVTEAVSVTGGATVKKKIALVG
jgi:hypothetical protein